MKNTIEELLYSAIGSLHFAAARAAMRGDMDEHKILTDEASRLTKLMDDILATKANLS